MNSDSFSEIMQEVNKESTSLKSAEFRRKEDLALGKADLIDSLVRHEGWQLIKTQLEEVKLRLLEELADVNRCDTLRKVQSRQYMVNAIELFLNSPKMFIEKRNTILSRRTKWQNKQP